MIKQIISMLLVLAIGAAVDAIGCTSAIFSGKVTRSGHPMLWKNRDTDARGNFVARVDGDGVSTIGYLGLFNEGDSLKREAWMGMNDEGFAIMNTASYNLAPDTAKIQDREGVIMARALATCRSLKDFEHYLDTLARPMGVQANFGVIDNQGNGAYYETTDVGYIKFDLADSQDGYITRSNYSESGWTDGGYGYIRRDNAEHFIRPAVERRDVTPALLTDTVSRSFYHSLIGRDLLETNDGYIVDLDFVPRMSTTASIVIEGTAAGDYPQFQVMWTALGYPPTAVTRAVMLRHVPEEVQPNGEKWQAPDNERSLELKQQIFDVKRGNGPKYINVEAARKLRRECGERSKESIAAGETLLIGEQKFYRGKARRRH